jgi:hypothetical protein
MENKRKLETNLLKKVTFEECAVKKYIGKGELFNDENWK